MFTPSPALWPDIIEQRQHRMRGASRRRRGAGRPAVRVRVRLGRLLIAAGSTLSGERVEMTSRRPALSRCA